MNEKFSFKMGVRFAASLDMGESFLGILYKVMYKNAWTELQCTSNIVATLGHPFLATISNWPLYPA